MWRFTACAYYKSPNKYIFNIKKFSSKQVTTKKKSESSKLHKKRSPLHNCSADVSTIVMAMNTKSIVGRLEHPRFYIRSVPISYNFHGNFGDQAITRNPNENEGSILELHKRAKYTCGLIVMENNYAKLVHMNNKRHVLAYLPSVKNSSQFEEDCLYSAHISELDIVRKIPIAKIGENLGIKTCPLSQLQAHIMYCGLNEHVYYEKCGRLTDKDDEIVDDWEPHPSELMGRRSFLDECVITIDPESAADFDDALSLRRCDDNSYEIGVHIADVTHFVKPGSENDTRASKLCATVYGKAKAFHMLPGILCKEKCSLKPGQLRLTYSAVLKYSPDGKLVDFWVGKGFIRSSARLTYEQAEDIINSNDSSNVAYTMSQNQEMWKLHGQKFQKLDVIQLVRSLNNISTEIWDRKVEAGRFSIGSQTLSFEIEPKNYQPTAMFLSIQLKSHRLIETMMCAANEAVASFLRQELTQGGAIVRMHSIERIPAAFAKLCDILKLPPACSKLNYTDFISQINNPNLKLFAGNFLIQNTKKSIYVAVNKDSHTSKYFHGGLAAPSYTHFTSPIRRYADIIVHRQLDDVLCGGNTKYDSKQIEQLEHIIDKININEFQISTLEAIDRRYYLHLYINRFGVLDNLTGGKTDDELLPTQKIQQPQQHCYKLFYPDLRCYIKTDTPIRKNINFLDTITAQVSSTTFPDWVNAKEVSLAA